VTAFAPFLVVFRSTYQKPLDEATLQRARTAFAKLSPTQQSNLRSLCHWFRLSGYPLACELG
jgi:hypothetical protein